VCAALDDLVIALYVTVDELVKPAAGRAAAPGCRTLSSSAWPWPRSCSATTPNAAGCGRWPPDWGTCSPMSAAKPPTTVGCAGGAAGGQHPARLGGGLAIVVRPVAAAGRYPGPMWAKPGDHQALRARRPRRLRLRHQSSPLYWGLKLYVLAAPDGMPVAWCLANPDQGEREVAEGLLDRAARQGGLRPGRRRRPGPAAAGRPGSRGLEWCARRGVPGRAGLWFNWQLGAPVRRSLVAFDH
jgi:hypothetical protein